MDTEAERRAQNRERVRLKQNVEAYLKQEEAVRGTPFDHQLPHHVRVAEHTPAQLPRPLSGFGLLPKD